MSGTMAGSGGVAGRESLGAGAENGGHPSNGSSGGMSGGARGGAAGLGEGGEGARDVAAGGMMSGASGTVAGTPGGRGGMDAGGSGGDAAAAGAHASGGQAARGGAAQGGRAAGGAAGSNAGRGGAGGGAGGMAFCTPALVVDDMEDGDALTCPNQGRGGDWWTATGTPTGTIDPPTNEDFPAYALGSDARAGSKYGMRLSGTGFGHTDDDWASVGFFLAGEAAYDLTPYAGLAFYAKSRTTSATQVHVKFATATTTPSSENGSCDTNCNDHYGATVTAGSDWQEYKVDFATLEQEGWGPKAKDLPRTLFVYFGFLGTDGGPANFDFLIDDVRLY